MAAVKKKVIKKQSADKSTAKKKAVVKQSLEPKLGHDPLAWITGSLDDVVSPANIVVEPKNLDSSDISPGYFQEPLDDIGVLDVIEDENIIAAEVHMNEEQVSFIEKKDNAMLNLPDVFGIAQAEVTFEEIKGLLVASDEIKIDGSAVETVDASALQLLVALFEECRSEGKKISWHAESEKINNSARLLNLTDSLMLKM